MIISFNMCQIAVVGLYISPMDENILTNDHIIQYVSNSSSGSVHFPHGCSCHSGPLMKYS